MEMGCRDEAEPLPSVVHLNSMLSGGGTDDQCVKLATACASSATGSGWRGRMGASSRA